MPETHLNQLATDLRTACAAHPTAEKWLLAPSRRLGQQWAEAVTRAGQPVLNLHLESFQSFALLRLAAPQLARRGLTFLRGLAHEVLVARLFARLRGEGEGYLSAQEPTPGLVRALTATLSDLRLAGLTAKRLPPARFEVPAKGRELVALLAAYEEELRATRQADYAAVLDLAAAHLKADPSALPADTRLLLPEDLLRDLSPRERALWEAVPEPQRLVLRVDHLEEAPEGPLTDAACLRWVLTPTAAPAPPGDGTATIFRAVGEVNEVREALQRCLADGLALDEVELLYTDAAAYLPLIYETATRLWGDGGAALPVTFAEGIPARYSRPARALLGWLAWVREECAQPHLAHLLHDGLLDVPGREEAGYSHARLAALLRGLPLGRGAARYPEVLARELQAVANRLVSEYEYEDSEDSRAYARAQRDRGAGLQLLRTVCEALLAELPLPNDPRALLAAATAFLTHHARDVSELDGYSRSRLLSEMRDLDACLEQGEVPGLDVAAWLAELVQTLHVNALGPRPGCLYVAPFAHGGHSGRAHTFLLGLDDGRFPGAGTQDPLLLDNERGRVSRDLPTAAGRLERRARALPELLARLRGHVTLSYSGHDVRDDRATFPASALWSAYRILSGERDGDQQAMLRWLPPPVSFAPLAPERCLDAASWWLWRLCGEETVADPEAALAACFPHLGRGFHAREQRASEAFTEYDGFVPEAGAEASPANHRVILSASRLETMGRCPLEYFLRYVLELEAPEEYTLDPAVWLDPAARGALLHRVFRTFMDRLAQQSKLPDYARDLPLLDQVLAEEIAACKQERPPHREEVCARECQDLSRIARVFLREEERFCRLSRPVCFEATLGLRVKGKPGFLDTPQPVELSLPGGLTLRARAMLDRVDQLADSGRATYTIWDYKTGSSRRYSRTDPFQQGRHLQNALYLALAQARLKTLQPEAEVASFGYFFPNLRDYGERLHWRADELAAGPAVIAALCRLIAAGAFPFTTDPADVKYSNYLAAYGDGPTACASIAHKLANPANAMLADYRLLRGNGATP